MQNVTVPAWLREKTSSAEARASGGWMLGVLLLALCLALPPRAVHAEVPDTETAARPSVQRISFAARSDRTGYVVRVHMTGPVGAYSEPKVEGGAIIWKLYNTGAAGTLQEASAPGPVARYQAEAQGEHLLLRFDMAPEGQVKVQAYRDRASDDLLMNVTYADGPPVRVASAEQQPAPGVTASRNKASDEEAASAEGRARSGTQGEAGERWKFDTVVIDAGHGGRDPGAQAYGLDEKDVVLGIAKKLGGYIEERLPGVDVVYTRDDDSFVTLRNRGHIANKAGGKLFISIHANAARNRAAHGTETYFLGTHKTDAARKVMKRENSVIQLEDNPTQYEDPTDGAMEEVAQSIYMGQSERLASLIQNQFEKRVERKNRGVKQAGFLVLWAASMPRVLVETGFVTNRAEARFLGSERGQTLIASGLFRAVRTFKKQYGKGLNVAAE